MRKKRKKPLEGSRKDDIGRMGGQEGAEGGRALVRGTGVDNIDI
jgi:hypothetical protein